VTASKFRTDVVDLFADQALAARLQYRDRTMHLLCHEGHWMLERRGRRAWLLTVVEHSARAPVGTYAGRRLRSGGTIQLNDGSRAKLRRRIGHGWHVTTGAGDTFIEIRTRQRDLDTVRLGHAVPGIVRAHLFVLIACGVVFLEAAAARATGDMGGGGG
jgi:hypothetical protein